MKQRFSAASVLILALSLAATTPVLAGQMEGHDKMGGGMSGKMSGMGGMDMMDKSQMKMMIGKMAAMPPAERKKAMQKMSGVGMPTDTGKMDGMEDKTGS